jgi:hypothetical protein
VTSAFNNMASLAARAGGSVVRQVRSVLDPTHAGSSRATDEPASRWLVATVAREPADVPVDRLPLPLAEYGDRIEVRIALAPADKGTELAVRLRQGDPRGRRDDARADLRAALRRAKQLIEVGEVLAVDPAPHGKRTGTPGGAVLEKVTDKADEEGVL